MGNKWATLFNLRRVLGLLILCSVLVLTVVLWRYQSRRPAEEMLEMLPKKVDLALEKLHYTHNENGQRSWSLTADQAEYQRESGLALLDKVHLEVFHAGQFGEVTLDSGKGQLLQEQQLVEVWEHVVVNTSRQEQLLTERLHYDGVRHRLTTEEHILLKTPRMQLTGKGMQVDLDEGRLLVKSAVRMLIRPAQKE